MKDPNPQSLEGEQSVLGSCLIAPEAITKARAILTPEDFYAVPHRVIFEAICGLADRGIEVDLLTLNEHLRQQEVLENVGGASYLIQLTHAIPDRGTANITYHARIVEEKATLRRVKDTVEQIRAMADSDLSADDLPAHLLKMQQKLEVAVTRPKYQSTDDELPLDAGDYLLSIGDPPPMIIDQIFPDNSFVLWVGKPKAGKSLYVMDVCHAVAAGRAVFGKFPVYKPGPVLYIDMENPAHEIGNRLLKRGVKPGMKTGVFIKKANFRLDVAGVSRVHKWVNVIKPSFVVIDSAREALGIKDWYGDPGEIIDKVRPVREFAQAVCPILMIAHSRKAEAVDAGDEISANNAFASAVDGWLSVRKVEFNTDRSLIHHYDVRGRGMLAEFVARLSPDDLSVQVLNELELVEQSHQAEYQKVTEMMNEAQEPMTAKEIGTCLKKSQSQTWRLITQMIKGGFLKSCGKADREGAKGAHPEVFQIYSFIHRNGHSQTDFEDLATLEAERNGEDTEDDAFA